MHNFAKEIRPIKSFLCKTDNFLYFSEGWFSSDFSQNCNQSTLYFLSTFMQSLASDLHMAQ